MGWRASELLEVAATLVEREKMSDLPSFTKERMPTRKKHDVTFLSEGRYEGEE